MYARANGIEAAIKIMPAAKLLPTLLQSKTESLPSGDTRPLEHALQEAVPSSDEYLPIGHDVHELDPEVGANEPTAHSVHAMLPDWAV